MTDNKETKEKPKVAKKKSKPKESDLLSLEEKIAALDKIHDIVEHMHNVNKAANTLVERLIRAEDSTKSTVEFCQRLIQRVRSHDVSKLSGIEWAYLTKEAKANPEKSNLFFLAIQQHWANNSHHPEYFVGGISEMTELDLAEMACDLKARSGEIEGGGLRDFVRNTITDKFGITTSSAAYRKLKKYIDILLDDTFG